MERLTFATLLADMIQPVTSTKTPSTYQTSPPIGSSTPLCSSSSLCSLSAIPCFFYRLVAKLFLFLKYLLGCGVTSTVLGWDFTPEINPSKIAEPFRSTVFETSFRGDYEFRHKEAYSDVSELFEFLGTHGGWEWTKNSVWLYSREWVIDAHKLNPLEFLYLVFLNQDTTQKMVHFHTVTVLGVQKGWRDFLSKHSKKLAQAKEILPDHLPGFCTGLGLNLSQAQKYIQNQEWNAFMNWVYDSRKKHFSL